MPNWKKLITSGSDAALKSLQITNTTNAGVDTDKFLVLDSSNNVDFRTGAEVRSDIGAGTGNGTVTGTGGNNRVATWNGSTSLDGSSNFTYDGTTLNLTYTGTGDLLRLTSTDAGAASAPDLTFCRDSASPADDDTLGTIQFYGEVSGTSVCKNYASIYGRIACATNGQTKGNLSFKAECNNVFIDTANFSPNGLYVMPPDDFAITSPGIGLTVTGGVSGSTTLQIGSGHTNTGTLSSIAGGTLNTVSAACGFIGGGSTNTIGASNCSVIVGGANNCITDSCSQASTIVGGGSHCIKGKYGFIGGGGANQICFLHDYAAIAGGHANIICSPYAFIGGGKGNCVKRDIMSNSGCYSAVVAGQNNSTNANFSFIGGGCANCIPCQGCFTSILGGQSNIVTSCHSSIGGGTLNTASGNFSFIGGGQSNIAEGVHSYAGGQESCTTGAQGFAHGYQACATGGASAAFGAVQEAIGDNSFIAGGASNSACAQYSFVGGFNNETTTSAKASSVLGENNCVNAPWSFAVGSDNCILGGNVLAVAGGNIVGGKVNRVQGTYSLGNLVMGNDNCIGDGSSGVGGAAAFGGGNCILADGTVAIGINNNNPVSGQTGYGCNTLLLGCNNQAHFGENNIIGGTDSDGYGTNSIAFGCGATSATGGQQYAFGTGTTNPNNGSTANTNDSFVIGRYNKWNISDSHLFAVGMGSGDNDALRSNAFNISSNGRTGLGCTSPQTRLDVNGTTRTTSLVETSARRYKENIVSLQDQLDNIKKLEPVEFEWKETKKKDIGLIAEDVEKVYPHLVEHDDNGDLMGVKYSKITSLLIKAVQEQQQQIEELKKEIFTIKQQR